MNEINIEVVKFKDWNHIYHRDSQISKWWGKTFFYCAPDGKLYQKNFTIIERMLRKIFGYRSEFNRQNLWNFTQKKHTNDASIDLPSKMSFRRIIAETLFSTKSNDDLTKNVNSDFKDKDHKDPIKQDSVIVKNDANISFKASLKSSSDLASKKLIGTYSIQDISLLDNTLLLNGKKWKARWSIEWKKGDLVSLYRDVHSDKGEFRMESNGKYNYCSPFSVLLPELPGYATSLEKTVMRGLITDIDYTSNTISYHASVLLKKQNHLPASLQSKQLIPNSWIIGDSIALKRERKGFVLKNLNKYDSLNIRL
jgi:hypothetical protein